MTPISYKNTRRIETMFLKDEAEKKREILVDASPVVDIKALL